MHLSRLLFRLALGRRLPRSSGRLRVEGLQSAVEIRRDKFSIPHIEAANSADAWFGLGFCQGQDRWFQIETLVRLARGSLAELAGADVVPLDRLSRRIGFRRAAEAQLPIIDSAYREMAEAFAAGANEGVRRGLSRRPHEFALLRSEPMTMDAVDVLGIGKIQSFLIPSNWDAELMRLKILTEDGLEALRSLDPAYPGDHPVTSPPSTLAGPAIDRLAGDIERLRNIAGDFGGSNNWVVGPGRTESGRALLANDPHLSPTLPPHWYLAHLHAPDWHVAGAALAGTPAILVGHNDVAAWGVTAGFVDNTDLFVEQLSADGASAFHGAQYVLCEMLRETIHVRRGKSVVENVAVTHNGPIIGPALEGEPGAVSIKATWLEALPVTGALGLYRAKSMNDVRVLARHWPLSSQNVVYADIQGNIGWQLFGDSPVRKTGAGLIPSPGWEPDSAWPEGLLPPDRLPSLLNPESEYIATANNKPESDGEVFLGADWLDGYRVARIGELIRERRDWGVASAQNLQMDRLTLLWREVRTAIEQLEPTSDDAVIGAGLLKSWDGVAEADSVSASVFEFFLSEMAHRMVQAKAPRSAGWALGRSFVSLLPTSPLGGKRGAQAARLLQEKPEGWFPQGWVSAAEESLGSAVRRLRKEFGEDPENWDWGRVRPLMLRHVVGDRRPFGRVFNRGPFAVGGDSNTIAAATTNVFDPSSDPSAIASLRMVLEPGDWENAQFSLPGGQSGNPVSPHYDDLLPNWLEGSGVPIAWSHESVQSATAARLVISSD
ncbi:MAG TPA: penicillin acylase family protein [Dehalococcoidia bacterium]|nr:penicillin acylase family protein [Dehalococcoidia bacterium]